MRVKLVVAILVVVLGVYLVLVGWRGVLLLGEGSAVGVALGLALVCLPLVGAWTVWRELRFGAATERLAAELVETGRWPTEELPTRPSGRPQRPAADALFEQRRVEVDAAPEDWGAWFRLGLAYEDAGDRRRARAAMRRAIDLHG